LRSSDIGRKCVGAIRLLGETIEVDRESLKLNGNGVNWLGVSQHFAYPSCLSSTVP
jgi:hypothetical protein